MTISVNNTLFQLPDGATVDQVLATMGINSLNGVAVAVNNHIIKKEDWSSCKLKQQDKVVLIRASQGG